MTRPYRSYEVQTKVGKDYVFRMRTESESAPIHKHWVAGRYHASCPCCWHGFAHTVGVHAHSVGEAMDPRTLLAHVEMVVVSFGDSVTQSTLDDLAVVRAAMQWPTFDDDEWTSFLVGMLDDIAR